MRIAALIFAMVLSTTAQSARAQEPAITDAGIVTGDCETTSIAYALTVPALPAGDPIGSSVGIPAGQSFTAVPVSLETLVSQESSIVLMGEDETVIACGPIGGVPSGDGSLVLGLAGTEGSGVEGIAYLAPDPAGLQTSISLFATGLQPGGDVAGGAREAIQGAIEENADEVAVAPTVPSVAPEVGLLADEQAYADAIAASSEVMSDSLTRFGDLFSNPRLEDSAWYALVAVELAIWDEQYALVSQLTPPPAFVEIHQKTLDAYSLYVLAGDDAERGLATFDASAFEDATAKIEEATRLIAEATALVNELTDQRNP